LTSAKETADQVPGAWDEASEDVADRAEGEAEAVERHVAVSAHLGNVVEGTAIGILSEHVISSFCE